MADKPQLVAAVRGKDLVSLKRLLERHQGAIPPQVVVDAGRLAWKPGLMQLRKHGADLNAVHRNYRPLHALIQEKPHAAPATTTLERVRCLAWLLQNGADPELLGAWPSARAIVVAAFVGDPGYVEALLEAGVARDVFSCAALGDARGIRRLLSADPALARARDGGVLTPLHCCAGSRLWKKEARIAKDLVAIARLLVDAGADPNATARSWGHDVDVSYFAIGSGQVETLKLLLERGMDAQAGIATAAWETREDILDLLLARGGRIDAVREHGKPLLNELIRWGQFKQARLLLARGASPNLPDERGWTSIHQAVSRGNVKMLHDLMLQRGDAKRADLAGQTPVEMARAAGRRDLLELLEKG